MCGEKKRDEVTEFQDSILVNTTAFYHSRSVQSFARVSHRRIRTGFISNRRAHKKSPIHVLKPCVGLKDQDELYKEIRLNDYLLVVRLSGR